MNNYNNTYIVSSNTYGNNYFNLTVNTSFNGVFDNAFPNKPYLSLQNRGNGSFLTMFYNNNSQDQLTSGTLESLSKSIDVNNIQKPSTCCKFSPSRS